jgi:hypothetical protein
VIALTIDEASAKVRTVPPVDAGDDLALAVWAGELPLSLAVGEPVPDDGISIAPPAYARSSARGHA